MGKWAPGHYDDVFTLKLKKIICSALEKNKQNLRVDEDGTPPPISPSSLTFESFVHELDESDPFFIGVAEILVKEVAARRDRKSTSSGSMSPGIPHMSEHAERTMRSLLGTTIRTAAPHTSFLGMARWRDRGGPPLDSLEAGDLAEPPHSPLDSMEDVDAEFDNNLYDAYYTTFASRPLWTSRWGLSPPPAVIDLPIPGMPPRSPGSTSAPQVRRRFPLRARTAEFASYSARLRSNQRRALAEETERIVRESDVYGRRSPPSPPPGPLPAPRSIRRSFDPVRDAVSRDDREIALFAGDDLGPVPAEDPPAPPSGNDVVEPPSSSSSSSRTLPLLLTPSHPRSPPPSSSASTGSGVGSYPYRPLRRGGIRAPELESFDRRYPSFPPAVLHRSPSPLNPSVPLSRSHRAEDISLSSVGASGADDPTAVVQLGTPRSSLTPPWQ